MSMEFTGERMVPEAADPATYWHHIYRYRFAIPLCRGRDTLDVACGEGYGCASLRAGGAGSIVGVDISPDACRNAEARYKVKALAAPAERIPLPDASLDAIVSFETVEHVPEPDAFLRECARLLRKDGLLIMSSPNRELYRLRNGINKFHCSELSEQEFLDMVSRYFHIEGRYGQYPELKPRGLLNPRLWRFLPWLRLRGANGIRRMAFRHLCTYFSRVSPTHHADPAKAVLGSLPSWNAWLNPNIVRPRLPGTALDFVFLVLVARRR